jgi:hypothetical protein
MAGLLCIIISQNSLAQSSPVDSSSQQNALNNAVTLYYASLGDQSPLYNGPEYYFYDPLIKGNAYFLDINAFAKGAVYYDGITYSGAPMLYDLCSDKLVLLLYNHFSKFSLIKDKVKSFDFLGHHFVNINADTIANNISDLKSGYYDELYNGKSEILVKRSKSIQTRTNTSNVESYFNPSKAYFIMKNKLYYGFTGKKSLLSILKDQRKALQQYIKANQIDFRAEQEEAMVKIASYYDHLTN